MDTDSGDVCEELCLEDRVAGERSMGGEEGEGDSCDSLNNKEFFKTKLIPIIASRNLYCHTIKYNFPLFKKFRQPDLGF